MSHSDRDNKNKFYQQNSEVEVKVSCINGATEYINCARLLEIIKIILLQCKIIKIILYLVLQRQQIFYVL